MEAHQEVEHLSDGAPQRPPAARVGAPAAPPRRRGPVLGRAPLAQPLQLGARRRPLDDEDGEDAVAEPLDGLVMFF